MIKSILLTQLSVVFLLTMGFSQSITYTIPFGSLIGMGLTSGDICSAPFNIEEAKQVSIGNTWGASWTSTNAGTATSIQIELSFTVSDTLTLYPTTLNGMPNNNVDPGPSVNCAAGTLLTWNIDPANYNSMGINTFMVDYSASTIINQLDNLPFKGDPFMRITVTYVGLGMDEEVDYGSKELVRITDLLGRETTYAPNKPLVYIYHDGSVRKVFQME